MTKVVPGASGVVTIYGQSGGVLGEYTASGAVLTESIWLGSELLAQVQGGQTNYAITDHAGTPFLLTDSHQSVVWQSVADPFGVSVRITGPANLAQRFPGQHADAETGLNQNYSRDYDPTLGRYIQSDPIGLDGGLNTYEYVGGNPLYDIDPTGRFSVSPTTLGTAATRAGAAEAIGGGPEDPLADIAAAALIIGTIVFTVDPPAPPPEEPKCKCPPCNPPAGSIRYRFDQVPPSVPHGPFLGDHYHIFTMNQDPVTCKCSYSKYTTDQPPPPGAQPF